MPEKKLIFYCYSCSQPIYSGDNFHIVTIHRTLHIGHGKDSNNKTCPERESK